MSPLRAIVTAFLLAALAGETPARASQPDIRRVAEALAEGKPQPVAGDLLTSVRVLPRLYGDRDHEPLWTRPESVRSMRRAIADAATHGLDPRDYHGEAVEGLLAHGAQGGWELDLLLTDALVRLAGDLGRGKVDPRSLDPHWNHEPPRFVAEPTALARAVEGGGLDTFLLGLAPDRASYRRLREALAAYRSLEAAGGWPSVPAGPSLKPGAVDARVPAIAKRLAATDGFDPSSLASGEAYDGALVEAVKVFQARHGLEADGVLGPATVRELAVPVGARIGQLRVALERARWMPRTLPDRLVLVNVAGFEAWFLERGEAVWSTRVIVGRPRTPTPVFRADMRYLVLNPTWTIPRSIVRDEILPELVRDPGWLEKKGYVNVEGRYVQPAGPENALGRIKLMFPNPHSVYMHDTPTKAYFERASRTYSHGCIRVQRPVELAALVLGDPAWSVHALEAAIAKGATRTIPLPSPLPVWVHYWTVSTTPEGQVEFHPDIYSRDGAVLHALDAGVDPAKAAASERPRG